MNKAEEFVYGLCRKSFLSLWSYPNPLGKDGKELCDILVVCDPEIIIVNLKDIGLKNSGDFSIDWKRWHSKAVEASYAQIYGAERWIKSAQSVIRNNGKPGLPFPKQSERRIHRVAVALGGEGKVPIEYGDFGRGFIHVFDEVSFGIVASELYCVPRSCEQGSDFGGWTQNRASSASFDPAGDPVCGYHSRIRTKLELVQTPSQVKRALLTAALANSPDRRGPFRILSALAGAIIPRRQKENNYSLPGFFASFLSPWSEPCYPQGSRLS